MSRNLVLRVLLTLALFALLYRYVDWATLFRALGEVDFALYALSTIVFLASFGLLASRLQILLRPTQFRRQTWLQLFSINMSSLFYGFAIPSDIGTAIARWYQLTRNSEGRALIALITLLERLLMLAASALFALVGLVSSQSVEVADFGRLALPVLALIFLLATLAAFVMLNRPLFSLFGKLVAAVQSRMKGETAQRVLGAYWRISDFQAVRSKVLQACAVQLLYHVILLIRFVLLFRALDLDLAIADTTWISMSVLLLTAIPVTIAGLGVREGGFAVFLAFFSIAPELGILLGLLTFSQLVGAIVLGGIVTVFDKGEKSRFKTDDG